MPVDTVTATVPVRPTERSARVLVTAFVAMWGLNLPLVAGLTTSSLAVLVSAPLWVTAVPRFRWGWQLALASAFAVMNGVLLALAFTGSRPMSNGLALAQLLLFVGGIGGIGLILWARCELSSRQIAMTVALAMLVGSAANVAGSPNPWKYFISAPLTVLVLAALDRRRGMPTVVALVALAGVGFATDSRSFAGLCALTLGLLLLQHLHGRRRAGWATKAGALALGCLLLFGGYQLATTLMTSGYLGEQAQARAEQQIALGGSLIGGGRPEWSGTLELARATPSGFGLGAVPTYEDIWTAREGLATVGIDVDNGYVEHYMFGRSFKLHSVTADLWSQFGIAGLVLALLLLAVVIVGLVERIAVGAAAPFLLFLGTKAVWDLAFSPAFSTLAWVGLAVGLLLLRTESSAGTGPATGPTEPRGPSPAPRRTGRFPGSPPASPS
jgi:hypothetical protein